MSKYLNVIVSWFNAIFIRKKGGASASPDLQTDRAGDHPQEDVEKVEAERVDPSAPLPLSDADMAEA